MSFPFVETWSNILNIEICTYLYIAKLRAFDLPADNAETFPEWLNNIIYIYCIQGVP